MLLRSRSYEAWNILIQKVGTDSRTAERPNSRTAEQPEKARLCGGAPPKKKLRTTMETSTPTNFRREPAVLVESSDLDNSTATSRMESTSDASLDQTTGGDAGLEVSDVSRIALTSTKEETVMERIVNHTVSCIEVMNYRDFKARPSCDSLFNDMMTGVDTFNWSGSSFNKSHGLGQS